MWDGNTLIFNTSNGANTNWDKLVVGSTTFSNEGANAEIYEVIGFDTKLVSDEQDKIKNLLAKYYTFV
jgi:hypothetical protein